MDINLHIERLVLDGINHSTREADQLVNSVKTELADVILVYMKSGGIEAPTSSKKPLSNFNQTTRIARSIAESIYKGINDE